MIEEIQVSRVTETKNKKHIRYLRNKLRSYINNSKNELSLSLNSNANFYELAYPNMMKLYWYYVAAVKKVRLLLGEIS